MNENPHDRQVGNIFSVATSLLAYYMQPVFIIDEKLHNIFIIALGSYGFLYLLYLQEAQIKHTFSNG